MTFGDIFKDLEIKDEYPRPYKPTYEQKVDRFLKKYLFKLIDCKIVDDFRMLHPKMTAFVLHNITPAVEAKIKERYHPERTTAINEDDIIAMVRSLPTNSLSLTLPTALFAVIPPTVTHMKLSLRYCIFGDLQLFF